MKRHNPNFALLSNEEITKKLSKCTPSKSSGAVTILLQRPEQQQDFGHIAMVVHDSHDLHLPDDHDTTHYVSFSPDKASMGPMLTGTKAKYDGFGTKLKGVTHVLTLYKVDTEAVLKKWDWLKKSGQMYDLVNWNCARAVVTVFNAGYPECMAMESALWTPEAAFEYLKQVCTYLHLRSRRQSGWR